MKFEYLKKKKKKGTEVMTSYRLLKKENMLIINKVSVNHDTSMRFTTNNPTFHMHRFICSILTLTCMQIIRNNVY